MTIKKIKNLLTVLFLGFNINYLFRGIMNQVELLNGNCFELIKNIPDNSIDLVITDPPYKFDSAGGGFFAKNKIDQRKYADDLMQINCCNFEPGPFLDLIKTKLKKVYIYTFCNKTLVADYIQWAKENKCNYDILVMCKSNPIPAYNNHYLSDVEYIIIIREPGTYFSKEKDIELYRKWFMTSCKKGIHPAEKPLELIKKFVRVASPPQSVILDPFMGSGTTGVACMELDRQFIGIELEEKYFEICQKRILNTQVENKEKTSKEGWLFDEAI